VTTTAVDQAIGKAIRDARESLKISQAELARRVGLKHAGSLWRIEDGRTRASTDRLSRIAAELGRSVGDLLAAAGLGAEDGADGAQSADEWRRDLVRIAGLAIAASEGAAPDYAAFQAAVSAHQKRAKRARR